MRRPEDEYDDFDRDPSDRPPRRRKSGSNTAIIIIVAVIAVMLVCGAPICIGLMLPAVQKIREAANRVKSSNNLKQVGLGVHMYHDDKGELPSNTYTPDGKPLLSWRVHILPYIEADDLYSKFKLDEPWDSPNNIRLLDRMPLVYAVPQKQTQPGLNKTHYRGFSSKGAIFERRLIVRPGATDPHKNVKLADRFGLQNIQDGQSMTLLAVEAADAVEWSKPDDLDASPGKPFPKLGIDGNSTANILFADGQVRPFRTNTPEATLRAIVTHSGGEPVPPDFDQH